MEKNIELENLEDVNTKDSTQVESVKGKERELNFELLRIFCAFIIVVTHFWGFMHLGEYSHIREPIYSLVRAFTNILGGYGVNCFILISGYFLSDSKFKSKKLLKIILQVAFCSIFLDICYLAYTREVTGIKEIISNLFPILHKTYWFPTTYVGLYLIFPLINKLVDNLTQTGHGKLIVLLTIIFSILPTIFMGVLPWYSDLLLFVYLYLIAAYIRKYNINYKDNKRLLLTIAIMIIVMYLITVLFMWVKLPVEEAFFAEAKSSIFMLILSVATFLLFKNIKIKENKIVPFLAKATFGVYLWHMHVDFSKVIMNQISKELTNYNNPTVLQYIVYLIIGSIIVYAICTILDTLRRKCLEEPLFKTKKFDKYFEKIDKFFEFE